MASLQLLRPSPDTRHMARDSVNPQPPAGVMSHPLPPLENEDPIIYLYLQSLQVTSFTPTSFLPPGTFPWALIQALYVTSALCSVLCPLRAATLWASPKDSNSVLRPASPSPSSPGAQSHLIPPEGSVLEATNSIDCFTKTILKDFI